MRGEQASADALLRAIEGAFEVRRRHQFFNWLLSRLGTLLPDRVAICGAWSLTHRTLVFEQFNCILLPDATMSELVGRPSALLEGIADEWVRRAAPVSILDLSVVTAVTAKRHVESLAAAGIRELLVHGVTRPQRPDEIETLFLFASPHVTIEAVHLRALQLLGPSLHQTYLRVLDTEINLKTQVPPMSAPTTSLANGASPRLLTLRELEILALIRDGLSNAQIGVSLGISPLTAKNHVQALLRKLGAHNRAQAVARALALGFMAGADVQAATVALSAQRPAVDRRRPSETI